MPKVTTSRFLCPQCGAPTSVMRTRAATSTRLIRYRRCTLDFVEILARCNDPTARRTIATALKTRLAALGVLDR